MVIRPLPPTAGRAVPLVAWLGDGGAEELVIARDVAAGFCQVVEDDAAWESAGVHPAVAVLAARAPAFWSLQTAAAVSRRWPLTPLVAAVTSLADGRRRSGPWLPGVEEVPWHELPGRLAWWLRELEAGRAGTLGLPATARREERIGDSAARVRRVVAAAGPAPTVSVVSQCRTALDGLVDLVVAAGFPPAARTRGRPRLDDAGDLLVWDVQQPSTTDLAWLGMLAANRPGLGIVLLDSFPRGDTARAAMRAGAAAVLGRPVGLEALAGTLLGLASRPRTAIGAAGCPG